MATEPKDSVAPRNQWKNLPFSQSTNSYAVQATPLSTKILTVHTEFYDHRMLETVVVV